MIARTRLLVLATLAACSDPPPDDVTPVDAPAPTLDAAVSTSECTAGGRTIYLNRTGGMYGPGAESSSAYRTNLILNEVGNDYCDVVVAAYLPGSFVPIATVGKRIPPLGYLSDELFRNILGLNLSELTDVRIVVRQVGGDGVFLAFASKIDLVSGDPANIFLRPATAGTGR